MALLEFANWHFRRYLYINQDTAECWYVDIKDDGKKREFWLAMEDQNISFLSGWKDKIDENGNEVKLSEYLELVEQAIPLAIRMYKDYFIL